jgi:hypothetical protein
MGPDAGKARGQSCPHFVLQQFIGLGLFVITTLLPLIATAQFTGGPPVINSQPKSQLVAAGTDVTFSVGTAPSFTPVRYQWRKAGADLAGATNSTLVISNAALGAAGNYNVVVANAAGAIPSDTATLTVAQASATPPSVSLGASVRLGVNTFSPTLGGYQWGFDGVIIPGATNRTLVLTNVQLANAGTYTVSVTNEVGSVTLSTTLSVDLTFTKIIGVDPVKPVEGNQPFVPHGCAWIDYNDDGYLDLLAWNIGNEVVHVRLFRNNRNGTFAPVPAPALINSFDGHSVATPADFDNDGYVDLLVSPLSPAKLFRNNHDGTFISVGAGQLTSQNQIRPPPNEAEEVGLGGAPVLSAWADYDNDGRVDVLLNTSLYKNNGDGTFTNTTAATFGPTRGTDKAFAARSWGDYDNDGYLDLFVFNWAGNNVNLLYHNNGDGTFKETASVASVNEGAAYSWTCGWGDYDNDGFLDLFVANNDPVRRNFLYHNNQNGTFSRSEAFDAVSPTNQWTYGCAWGDYDNDGFLDLYLSNGNAANNQNLLYHNNGDGTFTGILTGSPVNDADSFGACSWADYNNDGFLDLYVASATGNNRLYRNNTNNNSWVKVKCAGTVSNRAAIGSKVRVNAFYQGASRWQLREITGGDGDGNSQPLLAHFGLGDATNIDTVRIEWPSGIVQEMQNVAVKQRLEVTEPVLAIEPKAQDFVGGADFTFSVATNLTSSTNYQWRFTGTELAGETNAVLIVRSVGASSVGKYTVVVMFPNGDTVESGPAILKPPVAPNITAQPQSQTVAPGGTATFQVIATGSPPLLYQWHLNEAPIDGATNDTLTVTNALFVNAGDYTVEVRNLAGAVTSTNASLSLVGAAKVVVHPKDQIGSSQSQTSR